MSTASAEQSESPVMRSGAVCLVCALAAAQLVLHAWFAVSAGDPRMWMPHAAAWLLDVLVLIVAAAILAVIGWGLRRCGLPSGPWNCLSNALLFLMGLLLASYPVLLTEFLAFPMNIFRADTTTSVFFLREYLGWQGLWPLLVPCMIVGVASRMRWRSPSPRRRLAVVVPVVVLSAATLLRPAPQPLVYSAQDFLTNWLMGDKRTVPSLARPTATLSVPEDDAVFALQLDDMKAQRYDHILIMVLEGVTAARFEQEFLSRPHGYYAHVRDRSVYFDKYHTTNLDSYTSLIAMLTSVQVPYRAYADPSSYEAVNEGPNLVAALNQRGFHALYVCTAEHQPFVPVRKDWSRVWHMRDLTQPRDWLTIGGSKVESGVEDRAALPAIIEFLTAHPRTLVMQEMIFGHSPRWTARAGKSQLEYYDDYLLELLRGLEQQHLADRVLLVVLSDHGDRADAFNVENYHVPLLISGLGVPPSRDSALYSHSDLQALIGHFLADQPLPKARESLLTVGSTERWVYGQITSSGSYMLIDNDRGTVSASQGTLSAQALYESFQTLINRFAARYQR
jgi:hypothetical protein